MSLKADDEPYHVSTNRQREDKVTKSEDWIKREFNKLIKPGSIISNKTGFNSHKINKIIKKYS